MPSYELKCKILHIGKTTQVTDSYRKREIIVEADSDSQYPQTLKIEAGQAKCEDPFLDEARTGDEATIHFNLRGNVYDNKEKKRKEVFNSLAFWKGSLTRTTAAPAQQAATQYSAPAPVDFSTAQDDQNDLPF